MIGPRTEFEAAIVGHVEDARGQAQPVQIARHLARHERLALSEHSELE